MKKVISLMVIILLLAPGTVIANEEVKELSLEEAVNLGMKNNTKLQQVKRLYQQQKKELEVYKTMYPFNLGIQANSNYNLYEKEGWLKDYSAGNDSSQLNIINKFNPDSNLRLSQEILRKNDQDQIELEGNKGSLTYSHYLFKEYSESEDYHNKLLSKEISVLQKQKEYEDLKQEIKLEIVNKYYEVVRLKEKLKIKGEMLNQGRLTLQAAKTKVKAGDAVKLEEKEAKLQLEETKIDLIQLKSEYKLAVKELGKLLEIDLVQEVKLSAGDKLEFSISKAQVKEQVYTGNVEFKLLNKQIAKKEYNLKKLTGDNNLALKMTGEFGWRKEKKPETDYKIGLQLEYHFNNQDNKLKKQKLKQMELELANLKEELESKREDLTLEAEKNWVKFRSYQQKIDLYKGAVANAEKRLKIMRSKYKAGLVTISEVLAKEMELSEKKIDYINNLVAYNQQGYELKELIDQF